MTQKEQTERLDAFRGGEFEVLVSTSVAEEGLDVPDVDLVLFYEPVPKGIRSIQRKGRTGRASEGKVVVLIADDTRDEAFFWMSRNEEKRMEEELRKLKGMAGEVEAQLTQGSLNEFGGDADDASSDEDEADADDPNAAEASADAAEPERKGQAGLGSFADEESDGEAGDDEAKDSDTGDADDDADETEDADAVTAVAGTDEDAVEIVADQRELDSTIARDLSTRDGIETRLETLAVGDYVLSDRVVVERKTTADFLDTLLGEDRSMFEQVGDAVRSYARPVVVVEGDDLYGQRNVHPNAIRGALASLAVDFGASVLFTDDEDATTELLATIASREQTASDREVRVHGEKADKTLDEQQEYVVSSIAEVGPVTARALLAHFGSVERVVTADEAELLDVEGVGPVTAERIREVVGSDYAG
jgi:Fanconi anemia group M protein